MGGFSGQEGAAGKRFKNGVLEFEFRLERELLYACRRGKGTHRAILQASRHARSSRYVLKCDIADEGVLWLADLIVRSSPGGRGLPIGNLTSQCLANVYLDGFDHFVKENLRARRYLRYVDDFAGISPVTEGVDFLAFHLARQRRDGLVPAGTVRRSFESWSAHAAWGATAGLRRRLLAEAFRPRRRA